jgi:hypothetical protein
MDRNVQDPAESGLTRTPELVPLTERQMQFAAIVGRIIARRWRAATEANEPGAEWRPTQRPPRTA